ncbi:MAG: hypothetical protein SVK08_00115 [Halobacteriota archaeon]|nr:hypothetical protein [Halobacteriota archaeon]
MKIKIGKGSEIQIKMDYDRTLLLTATKIGDGEGKRIKEKAFWVIKDQVDQHNEVRVCLYNPEDEVHIDFVANDQESPQGHLDEWIKTK